MANKMVTYWDLPERSRARLTYDEVKSFIDAELMLKGVLKVEPLALLDEMPVHVPALTCYRIGGRYGIGVAFLSEKSARAFLDLNPLAVNSDWTTGEMIETVKPVDPKSTIELVEMVTREVVEDRQIALKERAVAVKENARRREEHDAQTKKVDEALRGLWDDWHACGAKDREMTKIAATFDRYVAIAHGDEAVARVFLALAFTQEKIAEAETWTERALGSST